GSPNARGVAGLAQRRLADPRAHQAHRCRGAYCVDRRVCVPGGDRARRRRPPRPAIGYGFLNVYAAGTYVLEAKPDVPFDPPRQYAREQELFGKTTPFYGWHYPPYFLFVAGALAKLPYGVALTVWQGSTLLLYLLMILGIASPSPRVRGEGRDEGASPPGSESRRG